MPRIFIISVILFAVTLKGAGIEGYAPVQITTDQSGESYVAAGEKDVIYFSSDRYGNLDVLKKDLKTDKITRMTYQPSNERPAFSGKKLLMISDETDIFGNIYFLSDDGDQELVYLSVGKETAPFMRDGRIYFCSGGRLLSVEPGGKKLKTHFSGIGEKAAFMPDGSLLFISENDQAGFNNLYMYPPGQVPSDPVRVTFGSRIISGFDVSNDGSFAVFSAVTSDTNGDGRTDITDNSSLYRIDYKENEFTDPLQLTPESFTALDPDIASDGRIYFISGRSGSSDVWSVSREGIVPDLADFSAQAALSESLFERYRSETALSEIAGERALGTDELLTSALLSYNRSIGKAGGTEEERAGVYFRIAGIYEAQGRTGSAESVYRILAGRFAGNETVTAEAEAGRIGAEIRRKALAEDVYGYELDDYVRYLTGLAGRYSVMEAKNTLLRKAGDILSKAGKFTEAGGLYMKALTASGGKEDPETYARYAVSSLSDGNLKASEELLSRAVKAAEDPAVRERYLRNYFDTVVKTEDYQSFLFGLTGNDKLPVEIRSCAALRSGDASDDISGKTASYGQVKEFYISRPDNITLKRYSAAADLKLALALHGGGYEDESEGLLKYIISGYTGFDYDRYPYFAGRKLSSFYLKRAERHTASKRYDNALLTYSVAFGLDKKDPEIIRGVADSYTKLGKINEGINFFEAELAADPQSQYIHYALGYIYSLRATSVTPPSGKDMMTAASYLDRAVEIDGSLKYAYLTLSYCYEALHHIRISQEEQRKDKNFFLKAFDYITGPFRFVLETVNILGDSDADYTDMSVTLLNRGISLCTEEKDRSLRMKMKLNLANTYYNMGEYARKQALVQYMDIISNGFEFSSEEQKAYVFERTGHCMFTTGDERAAEYYEKALEIFRKISDRQSELRVSMRTALLYLTMEDSEGDVIGGDEAYRKYSDIILKLKSDDNGKAVDLIKRNSAFARLTDQEYAASAKIVDGIIGEGVNAPESGRGGNMIVLNLLGLDIPVWKLDLVLGSIYSEGFRGSDELALLYSMQASNYQNIKDFGRVRKYLEEKAEVFRKRDNKLALSLVENRLGVTEYSSGNWNAGADRFVKSKELCLELELFNSALENENNILKTILKGAQLDLPDTTVLSLSKGTADPAARAENLNLRGVLRYRDYISLTKGGPAEIYRGMKALLDAHDLLAAADSLLNYRGGSQELKNRMKAAVLYNLSAVLSAEGDPEKAASVLAKGRETADLTLDKLLKWRYLLKAGDLENDADKKLGLYLEAEKVLSQYLPPTSDYELVTGWRDDIRPLYDRIIGIYYASGEYEKAFNYSERFRSRYFLDLYSSRYIDFKEQLHRIHVRKIRYNNDEIVRYRHLAETLRNKNAEKFGPLIEEYEEKAVFYQEELEEIFGQIRNSNDERLLQFVSINDTDLETLDGLLGEYRAVMSVYSMPDSVICMYRDYKGTEAFICRKDSIVLDPVSDRLEEIEHLFMIPDGVPQSPGGAPEHLAVTCLPTAVSLKTVTENANINYSEYKKASAAAISEHDISSAFENGGIIYFDQPASASDFNPLESVMSYGGVKVRTGDLMKYKIPAYAVLTEGFIPSAGEDDIPLAANSFIFAGAQTVIFPGVGEGCIRTLSEKLRQEAAERDIMTIIRENNISCVVYGLPGMDGKAQKEFASENLRSSLVNGIRYFNSKVYEKAAVHFIQALAMARNTGDAQELNILKTLVASLSRMKDYGRAVRYGKELIAYALKNDLQEELLNAYDTVSKDYFRAGDYGKSAEYQLMIAENADSSQERTASAYDMLSVISSYQGNYQKSIEYKQKYLSAAGLAGDSFFDIGRPEEGKKASLLFNSLRNIMVSYYRAGKTDSALVVYKTIDDNLDIFEDVDGADYGTLLESAGLCHMKLSSYADAEGFFNEAMEYFGTDEEKVPLYLDLADVYYYTDRLQSSLKSIGTALKHAKSDADLIRAYNTKSLVEVKLNDLAAAASASYSALERTIALNDSSEEATARVNLAKIMILKGDIAAAARNLEKSAYLARRTDNRAALASSHFYRADIFRESSNIPDSALTYYRKCADISASSGDNYFLSRAYLGLSYAFSDMSTPDSAVTYAQKSLEISGRSGYNDVFLSSSDQLSELYEKDMPSASAEVLTSMTRRAGEMLSKSENRLPSGQAETVLKGYGRLIYLMLEAGETDRAVSEVVKRDIFRSASDRKYFPELHAAATEITVLSGASLSEPGSGEALIMFLPYGKKAKTVIFSDGRVSVHGFTVTQDIQEFVSAVTSKGNFTPSSKKVYDLIFTKEVLSVLSGIKRIVVYTSGGMKNFPFEALTDGREFLVDRFDIAETGSIPQGADAAGWKTGISFFDPFTAESDLVYAEREASSLKDALPNTTPVTGMEATESLFRSPMMEDYSVIHLPVHSFSLTRDSLAASGRTSYIQLSADDFNDGRLEWNEIASGGYAGKSIILSGCDTGGGTGPDYYSSFDLSQAFFEAGAAAVVSSRWRTDDLAASVLMKRYFRYLASGMGNAEALSQAKRDVRTYLNPHPYYWANFKLSVN